FAAGMLQVELQRRLREAELAQPVEQAGALEHQLELLAGAGAEQPSRPLRTAEIGQQVLDGELPAGVARRLPVRRREALAGARLARQPPGARQGHLGGGRRLDSLAAGPQAREEAGAVAPGMLP